MDNIIPFPGRHRGTKTQDSQWEQFVQSVDVPEIVVDIVRRFPHSSYFDYINDEQWENVKFQLTPINPEESVGGLTIFTTVRETLTPQFGIQNQTLFLALNYGYRDTPVEIKKPSIDLFHITSDYICSFPKIKSELGVF